MRVLLQADAHEVLPLGRVALWEIDLVAVHDQCRRLHLRDAEQASSAHASLTFSAPCCFHAMNQKLPHTGSSHGL